MLPTPVDNSIALKIIKVTIVHAGKENQAHVQAEQAE